MKETDEIYRIAHQVNDHVGAMLAYWDSDEVCRYANKAYLEWFGISNANLINSMTLEGLLKDVYPEVKPYIDGVLAGQRQVFDKIMQLPDGQSKPARIYFYPHEEDTFISGFFVHVVDMSPIKSLEERNKELEQITYIASHDLQEPLRTISTLIEVLNDQFKDDQNVFVRNSFRFITEASARMKSLIKALLDYSRLGIDAKIKQVDCGNLVHEVCSDLSSVINQSNAILHIGRLPVMEAYETELRLLFQNLISNALKFRKTDVVPEIFVAAELIGDHWEFSIRDNGIGIDPQYKERIFVIFQRLHSREEYSGTGIGLAHSKRIVELHKGNIRVSSEEGHGSTFYFTISTKLNPYEKDKWS